ncbi:MAG: YciI family protein [Paludibaculum sp.]
MKFLCLVFVDESKLEALTPRESQDLDDVSLAYDGTLRRQGQYLAAQALESVRSAVVVRLQDGKVKVTDGPYAEAREQVGGFILIEARDREEAIEVAAQIPAIQLGGIEIRPVKELVASSSLVATP